MSNGSSTVPFARLLGRHGGPLSPRIFNLMVDVVIWEWLRQVLGERVATDGIRTQIRLPLAAFYADDGLVQSRD